MIRFLQTWPQSLKSEGIPLSLFDKVRLATDVSDNWKYKESVPSTS